MYPPQPANFRRSRAGAQSLEAYKIPQLLGNHPEVCMTLVKQRNEYWKVKLCDVWRPAVFLTENYGLNTAVDQHAITIGAEKKTLYFVFEKKAVVACENGPPTGDLNTGCVVLYWGSKPNRFSQLPRIHGGLEDLSSEGPQVVPGVGPEVVTLPGTQRKQTPRKRRHCTIL